MKPDWPVTLKWVFPGRVPPGRFAMKRRNRLVAGGILAVAVALAAAGAWPHSKKETTMPVDGAVLDAAPAAIGMTFDRPMRITLIRLLDADGGEHVLTRTDGLAPVTEFRAAPGALAPGRYRVEWRGLADDGHSMEGGFSFEIRN